MPSSATIGAQLTTKRQEHGAWLAGFKTADGYDMTSDQLKTFETRNAELTKLQGEFETALTLEKSAEENETKLAPQGRITKDGGDPETKDLPDGIVTKAQYQVAFKSALERNAQVLGEIAKGGRGAVSFDLGMSLKTLLTTADIAPQADRQGVFGSALYYGNTEDLFMQGSTGSKSVDYYIQTTDTDNAAAVAQGSAATDSAFSWTLTTDPVETVQDWIPLTHESVSDNVGLMSTVQTLLANRLQKKSNQICLSGTGVTPIPTGVFIRTGFQTQAKGADPAFDAIHKAITKVEVTGGAICDAIAIHPTDWENLVLTRTSQGLYVLGNPASTSALNLWGLPVRKTTGVVAAGTAGTAGVGAFGTWAQVINREGLTVEISTEHSTFFTERKVALMLYRRFVVADYRPSAFATVTGL
jgi:HK97 family phage major capsid protein